MKLKSKLRTFFEAFKNSAFRPGYYRQVLKAKFSFSLKYCLFLFWLLGSTAALVFSLYFLNNLNPYLQDLKTKLPEIYPEELVIEIKDGQAAVNVDQPYFIPLEPELFPPDLKQGLERQPIQNILVIDTQAEPLDIKNYQAFALLTKESVALRRNHEEITIYSLEEAGPLSLDQQTVKTAWQQISPYLDWIAPVLITASFIFIPLALISSRFLLIGLVSLPLWLISKLFKDLKLKYRQALQINLQAITLPTIALSLFQLVGASPPIPFFQVIILLIYNLIIFASLAEK